MWLDIYRSNKFTQPFEVGVVKHGWALPRSCQIVAQLYLKNELNQKVVFLTCGQESIEVTNFFNHFKLIQLFHAV